MSSRRPSLNRRDLVRRLGSRAEPASIVATPPAGRFDLLKASRPAMGSYFEVRLPASTPCGTQLAMAALDVVDELESQLTIYRDDSEISVLNATAHLGPVKVEPRLFRLLRQAVALSHATEGAYDVASGALSHAWGFVRGPKKVPGAEALADALARSGSNHLILNEGDGTLAFDRPGIVLNLGSIGKGYAIDRAIDVIRDHFWPTSALIHGGQSSAFGLGSPAGKWGVGWEIAFRNPFDPARSLGTLLLRNRGIGTSGAAFQSFEEDGRRFGHLIDPRTGSPPQSGPASVTVLAPTAAEADALSTAFYLLGPEASRPYLDGRPDVGALFVLNGHDDGRPRVVAFNVTMDDYQPARFVRSGTVSVSR